MCHCACAIEVPPKGGRRPKGTKIVGGTSCEAPNFFELQRTWQHTSVVHRGRLRDTPRRRCFACMHFHGSCDLLSSLSPATLEGERREDRHVQNARAQA